MACSFEVKVFEYLENQLPDNERRAVEDHLAICAECREFAQELKKVDAMLAQSIKAPALSSEFSAKLAQRITAETAVLSPSERLERKRALEADYQAEVTRWSRSFGISALMDTVGWVGIGVVICWLVAPVFSTWVTHHESGAGQQTLLSAAMWGGMLLLVVGAAFSQQVRRYWMSRV